MRRDEERRYVEFVTLRIPALRRLARLLCGDWHLADDIVQDTLTALYVRWRRARAADDIDRYVRRMLVNTFLNERRRAWTTRVRLGVAAPDTPIQPDEAFDDHELLARVLPRVAPKQRAAVVLRYLYDLPVVEVAQLLGCSSGTVKSQTAHGLAALRRLLGDRETASTIKEH